MTKQPGARERQKADRRERILRAALQLIEERGFHAATYDMIAARAGVSRGTVFNYFPYKESILLDLAAAELTELAQRVRQRREGGHGFGVLDELRFLFDELAGFVETRRELVLPLSYELLNPDPERSRGAFLALPLGELLKGALKRGADDGVVRSDFSVERLARTLANTYFITALQWAAYRPERSLRRELEAALEIALQGLLERRTAAEVGDEVELTPQ